LCNGVSECDGGYAGAEGGERDAKERVAGALVSLSGLLGPWRSYFVLENHGGDWISCRVTKRLEVEKYCPLPKASRLIWGDAVRGEWKDVPNWDVVAWKMCCRGWRIYDRGGKWDADNLGHGGGNERPSDTEVFLLSGGFFWLPRKRR